MRKFSSDKGSDRRHVQTSNLVGKCLKPHLRRQRYRPTVEPRGEIGVVRTQGLLADSKSSSIQRIRLGMLVLGSE